MAELCSQSIRGNLQRIKLTVVTAKSGKPVRQVVELKGLDWEAVWQLSPNANVMLLGAEASGGLYCVGYSQALFWASSACAFPLVVLAVRWRRSSRFVRFVSSGSVESASRVRAGLETSPLNPGTES